MCLDIAWASQYDIIRLEESGTMSLKASENFIALFALFCQVESLQFFIMMQA